MEYRIEQRTILTLSLSVCVNERGWFDRRRERKVSLLELFGRDEVYEVGVQAGCVSDG